ncbi:hypothetical protein ABPG72_012516 [Tetrahymena utriculariae]
MKEDIAEKLQKQREIQLKIQTPLQPVAEVDPDKEWEKLMRKMSYKMPQTFKYSFVLFLGLGFIVAIGAKKASRFFIYPMIGTPVLGLGLCYNDFYKMYDIKFNMQRRKD